MSNAVLLMARARGMRGLGSTEDIGDNGEIIDVPDNSGGSLYPNGFPSSGGGNSNWMTLAQSLGADVASIFKSVHTPTPGTSGLTLAQQQAVAAAAANAASSSSNAPSASLSADSKGLILFGTRVSWPTVAIGFLAFFLVQHPGFRKR